MPWRSPKACSRCGAIVAPGDPCDCVRVRTKRQTTTERGYGARHRYKFRRNVLRRDPLCVLCGAVATVADHYPRTRKQLVADGCDPDDAQYGRGLCDVCHNRHTAATSPGGWNMRQ